MGKSNFLARYLIAELGVPTIFLANRKTLIDDAASDFVSGIEGLDPSEVGYIKDGMFGSYKVKADTQASEIDDLKNKKIIVATVQSIKSKLDDPRTSDILRHWLQDTCKLLCLDECQSAGSQIFDEVLEVINAPRRIFLSATP